MENSTKHNPRTGGAARTIVAALALATAIGGMSSVIARADSDDRRHEDRGHHVRHRHIEPVYRGYVYERPRAYYAPPPVDYYQPPQPSPGINFVFPLHIR